MTCFHPIPAYRDGDGPIQFHDTGKGRPIEIPCGQCIGCRLERSRQWAMRCVHEASLHDDNCFVTLTYNDQHIPSDAGLRHRDYQLFMKRLRKAYPKKKLNSTSVENTVIATLVLIITVYYSVSILMIGCIYLIRRLANLFIPLPRSKKYGASDLSRLEQLRLKARRTWHGM